MKEAVVQPANNPPVVAAKTTQVGLPVLRRKCACGGTPGPSGECEACRKKRLGLQRLATGAGPSVAPPIVHDVLQSPGQSLDTGTRGMMEARFGHDFSRVQVHTDAKAASSAQAVNALAYTVGNSVVFGSGQYAPATEHGRRLLAHELTHVVQQAGMAQPAVGQLLVGESHTSEEQAAERMAERLFQPVSRQQPAGMHWNRAVIQRQELEPDAQPADTPTGGGLAPGNEHVFSSPDGVKVVVFRKCGTSEFGFAKIETATNAAFDKIFNSDCISSDRRAILQKNLKQFGLRIYCKQPYEISLGPNRCAESSPDGQVNLSSIAFSQNKNFDAECASGSLEIVMLHEIMHASLGASTETFPRSCESSCFGKARGEGPDLCKNPKAPNSVD